MVVPVLSDYLQTMGGRMLAGRDLTDAARQTRRRPPDRNQIFFPSHSPGGFFSTFVVRVNGRA